MITCGLQNTDEMNAGKGSISLPNVYDLFRIIIYLLAAASRPLNYILWVYKQPMSKNLLVTQFCGWWSEGTAWELLSFSAQSFV